MSRLQATIRRGGIVPPLPDVEPLWRVSCGRPGCGRYFGYLWPGPSGAELVFPNGRWRLDRKVGAFARAASGGRETHLTGGALLPLVIQCPQCLAIQDVAME